MKLLMILGGLLGFGMGVGLGLAHGRPWPDIFWRASVAALVAGWVFRWWGGVCFRGFVAAHRERLTHAAKAEAAAASDSARV